MSDDAQSAPESASPLDALLALQAEDLHADQLRYQQEHSPTRVALAAIDVHERTLDAERGALEPERQALEGRQRALEAEVSDAEARIAAIDARLRSEQSGSFRDQQAMSLELESVVQRKRELEDLELAVMEQAEPLEASLAGIEESRRGLASERARLTMLLRDEDTAVLAQLAELESRRNALAATIPPALVAEYEKLRARGGGIGAARLVHGTCSGCNLSLSSTELDRIRHGTSGSVPHCEQCGRILVP